MLKTNIYPVLIICVLFCIVGCSKNSDPATDPCTGVAANFSADVQPIINTTCATSSGCHGTGSTNSGGPFTDYNKIYVHRSDIQFQITTGQMPKVGSLTADQRNKILCWISNGAPNN